MTAKSHSDQALMVEDVITDFIGHSSENTLQGAFLEEAFENPLVGFSKGEDHIYDSSKSYIGDFHWTPMEDIFPDLSR